MQSFFYGLKYCMDPLGLTFVDYTFMRKDDRIEFDHELTLGKLGVKAGDMFQVCEGPQGRVILQKVDPVVAFTMGYAVNCDKY